MMRPGTARLPRRFAPRNDTSGSVVVHQRPHAVECSPTGRSLSAATDAIGPCVLSTPCTNCKCLPEIATSAYGLLAMTNLVAGAVGGVHRNLQLPMALTERRYSQTWQRIRSAMPFPFRQCLPEIATSAVGLLAMTNLEAFAVLTIARFLRRSSAGSGCPLPYRVRAVVAPQSTRSNTIGYSEPNIPPQSPLSSSCGGVR